IQIIVNQGKEAYVFTKPHDVKKQTFARNLGAVWAGDTTSFVPALLDAAILFAPVGDLVPIGLRSVKKAGIVVCAGIHMSDIPSLHYHILWEEKVLRSVANVTRKAGEEFFKLLSSSGRLHSEIHTYPLEKANSALEDIRTGRIAGAAVLVFED